MARPEKEAAVAELTTKLQAASAVIVTDYRGLPVKGLSELRRQLRESGAEYVVAKNTLLRRAADSAGMSDLSPALEGPTAVVFGADNPAATAKALLAFARQAGLPQVRGVLMGGKLFPATAAKELANLPGIEGLYAMVMCGLEAPITQLLAMLEAPIAELVATLDAIANQRESVAA